MIREASQLVDPREYNRSQFDGLVSQLSKQINFNKGDIRVLDLFDEPTVSVGSVSAPLNGYQNLGFLEVKISIPQEMPSIKLFNNGRDISINPPTKFPDSFESPNSFSANLYTLALSKAILEVIPEVTDPAYRTKAEIWKSKEQKMVDKLTQVL